MRRTTLIQLRTHIRRTQAVIVAVMIGVGFSCATLLFGDILQGSIRETVGMQFRGADIVITEDTGRIAPGLAEVVRDVEGVQDAELILAGYGEVRVGGTVSTLRAGTLSRFPELRDQMPLQEGRLTVAADEVALTHKAASSIGVRIGDTLTYASWSGDSSDGAATGYSVVGIVAGATPLERT